MDTVGTLRSWFAARTARLSLLYLLLLLLLPLCHAQAAPSMTPLPTGPKKGQNATEGVPIVTIKHGQDILYYNLTRTQPIVMVRFDEDVTNLAAEVDLYVNSSDYDVPRVFVTTAPTPYFYVGKSMPDPTSGGMAVPGYNVINMDDQNRWELMFNQGFANWTQGFTLAGGVDDSVSPTRPTFLVGLGIADDITYDPSLITTDSTVELSLYFQRNFSEPPYQLSSLRSILGDTTRAGALLFSPVLYKDPLPQPSYPNYTLPGPSLDIADWDWGQAPDTTDPRVYPLGRGNAGAMLGKTADSPLSRGLGNSLYAIIKWNGTAGVNYGENGTHWMSVGNEEGVRTWTMLTNLEPNTNYTFWSVSSDLSILSEPIWFMTKDDSFKCNLVLPNSFCPSVGYAAPFDSVSGDASDPRALIPGSVNDTITANLQAFSTSLGANGLACGRDMYSFVSSCLDCYTAYRNWLCHILIPQCADPNLPPFMNTTGAKAPTAAFTIPRPTDQPRNAAVMNYTMDYTEMMPCLGLCTLVERKCPTTVGWNCPHRNFNANDSYAFIGHDNKKNDGNPRNGWPATDVWGNQWCSGQT